ncbi:alkaline ceramidase [Wuchereria bancrofti]|nr:alkaline ceramidase [Wuchereria bancrofti]
MRLDRWFDYESGYAWCESAYKYQTVSVVAEFANTVTNLPLIMLPLLNVLLIKPYIETVNWIVIMPHILLTVNGQLIDEISILWLLMMCLAAYFPVFSFYPQQYHKYIGRVRCAIAVITMVVSTFCFVKPSLNALVLMLWSIPSIAIIRHEAANAGIPEIISSPRKISVLWTAASICWVSDRVFCDFWLF